MAAAVWAKVTDLSSLLELHWVGSLQGLLRVHPAGSAVPSALASGAQIRFRNTAETVDASPVWHMQRYLPSAEAHEVEALVTVFFHTYPNFQRLRKCRIYKTTIPVYSFNFILYKIIFADHPNISGMINNAKDRSLLQSYLNRITNQTPLSNKQFNIVNARSCILEGRMEDFFHKAVSQQRR